MQSKFVFSSWLLQIVLVATVTTTRALPKGAVRSQQTSTGKEFYLSSNAGYYEQAQEDCEENYNGQIARIQTKEELTAIKKLVRGMAVSKVWIGLSPNEDILEECFPPKPIKFAEKCWVWGDIEQQVAVDSNAVKWSSSVTKRLQNRLDHGILEIRYSKLNLAENTLTFRYICERNVNDGGSEEEPEVPQPCAIDNDLVIAVDSSGSIGAQNYKVALDFVARLASAWAENANNRLGIFIYSDTVQRIISLAQNVTVTDVKSVVLASPYMARGTASHLALERALAEFQENPRDVPQTLVFLTDGVSNDRNATIKAADKVVKAGIKSYSVGIGTGTESEELLAVAGNIQNNVFSANSFDELLKLLKSISEEVCK